MANRDFQVQANRQFFSLRNIIIAAGIAVVAPYVIRRVIGLLDGGIGNVTGNDMLLAGKDGVRDAADDMNVGGVKGTLKRTVGRVSDHLRTDV